MAKEENTFLDNVVELSVSLIVGYAISKFVRVALARGESMIPTIKNNQVILLDCRAYKRRQPNRHDLIAFRAHQKNQHKFFLKRVIGVPGDHIIIENGCVFINGEQLEEPYINEAMKKSKKLDLVVTADHLFVMGDNRNYSLDSRATSLGLVNFKTDVVGVVKQLRK